MKQQRKQTRKQRTCENINRASISIDNTTDWSVVAVAPIPLCKQQIETKNVAQLHSVVSVCHVVLLPFIHPLDSEEN